ncbi:hypothetical protein [Teichococcus rhizosphaerae]|uniref:hypothetical protein n=1 Tax=Teichococcus rhizosphaerae TaxID=1335062 RepID=UPI00114530E1|nr:hypothetical protein [Pseudoroseomonas rhizosphaerae]
MAKLSVKKYIETGSAAFSFISDDKDYVNFDLLSVENFTWYRHFIQHKAACFRVSGNIFLLPRRQCLDLLSLCKFALRQNGCFQIRAENFSESEISHISILLSDLYSLGFAVRVCKNSEAADKKDQLVIEAFKISDDFSVLSGIEPIYAIGDSHVRFLAGKDETSQAVGLNHGIKLYRGMVPEFVGLHLGAGLAFHLGSKGTRTHATEKIEALLNTNDIVPKGAKVLFSFGEVDCRAHICQQAERQGRLISEIVDQICKKVIEFFDVVASRGYRPIAWGPIAPTWQDAINDPRYPVYGTFAQRKEATLRFNNTLKLLCVERGYSFLSIAESLFQPADGMTDKQYYCDNVHCSQAARIFLYPELEHASKL